MLHSSNTNLIACSALFAWRLRKVASALAKRETKYFNGSSEVPCGLLSLLNNYQFFYFITNSKYINALR